MKSKIVKGAGAALAGVLVLAFGAALFVDLDGVPQYPHPTPSSPQVEITPARVARGAKLASLLCFDCHENQETKRLTGKRLADLPAEFGPTFSKNITRHPEKGIGKWTDAELRYFFRTGVRPDGQYVPPYMIKMPHLSDDDLDSLIAFLHSDDPHVAASDVDPPGVSKPTFLVKALTHTVMKPLPYPTQRLEAPPKTDRVAYGRYLTLSLDCYTCHSADFKSLNPMEPEKSEGFLGGGNKMLDPQGHEIFTANLTPDDETGIGRWSEADFVRAVRRGFRPDGRVLGFPMNPMPELDDEEVGAIYAYLRTVPKRSNAVKHAPPPPQTIADGRGPQLYRSYGCVACHGESGAGQIGDLRRANEHYPTDADLRAWLDDAPTKKPGTKMPGWKGIIKEEDYAPLMDHVRQLSTGAAKQVSNR